MPLKSRLLGLVRGRIDRRRVVAVLLAAAIGSLAAHSVERARLVTAELGPTQPVVVALADLPAGHRIERTDLGVQQRPPRFVPAGAFANTDDVIGSVVRSDVITGEPIDDRRVRSSRLGLGIDERAVTLPIPLAPPPVVVGDAVELIGVGLVAGTDVISTRPLGTGRVVTIDPTGLTVAVTAARVTALVEYLAIGSVEIVITPLTSAS
ncbi:MAG: hypothetical protein ACI8TP_003213 [Acidimicrobiales bacterium]|jgi:hypothetical protein